MGDYLLNSMFVGHLQEFLFKQQHIPWESPHSSLFEDATSEFNEEIGTAVVTIWNEFDNDFLACYRELKEKGVENKEYFSQFAVSAADMYFLKGYNPGSFLGYCAIVLGVSSIYYTFPSNGIPEIAAEVVALVLLAHQITGQFDKQGGWDGLRKISELFNKLGLET